MNSVKPHSSAVFHAFSDCLARFKPSHPEFKLEVTQGANGNLRLNYTNKKSASLAPSAASKLYKKLEKAVEALGILQQENRDRFWFLWVESVIAATQNPYNYYVYADQMEYDQFLNGGQSFAVGFSLQADKDKMLVKQVNDATLTEAGLRLGAEIISITSAAVEVKSEYSWWLQQAPFRYLLKFKIDGQLRTIEAMSIPFQANEFIGIYWGDIAYIRINSFTGRSEIEMSRFMRDVAERAKGIVLDLRFNGGGVVSPLVVDYFLKPSQNILVFKYLQQELELMPGSVAYTFLPLVVLQNRYSASMSEVVSAAIKSQKRGIIIGETSFGKGVGQTIYPVSSEGAVALVETEFFYPDGESSWHNKGVEPDIFIEVSEADMTQLINALYSEHIDLEQMVQFDRALFTAREALIKTVAGK